MQASADSMRGLVRIKIADDNDIKARQHPSHPNPTPDPTLTLT